MELGLLIGHLTNFTICSVNVVVMRKVLLTTFYSFDSPFLFGKINATQQLLCVLIPCTG